jgi:hypothetical protein
VQKAKHRVAATPTCAPSRPYERSQIRQNENALERVGAKRQNWFHHPGSEPGPRGELPAAGQNGFVLGMPAKRVGAKRQNWFHHPGSEPGPRGELPAAGQNGFVMGMPAKRVGAKRQNSFHHPRQRARPAWRAACSRAEWFCVGDARKACWSEATKFVSPPKAASPARVASCLQQGRMVLCWGCPQSVLERSDKI